VDRRPRLQPVPRAESNQPADHREEVDASRPRAKKKIGSSDYYYLGYREGKKVKTDYIGKAEPLELKKQIEQRKWIRKQMKRIDVALYALGVAKRSQGLGLAKRFAILERDDFTCQYCGRNAREHKVVLVIDHVRPLKKGGNDSFDNLITACVVMKHH
jgi:predicted restriction endonuclease